MEVKQIEKKFSLFFFFLPQKKWNLKTKILGVGFTKIHILEQFPRKSRRKLFQVVISKQDDVLFLKVGEFY